MLWVEAIAFTPSYCKISWSIIQNPAKRFIVQGPTVCHIKLGEIRGDERTSPALTVDPDIVAESDIGSTEPT